jgi:hypothetical protein
VELKYPPAPAPEPPFPLFSQDAPVEVGPYQDPAPPPVEVTVPVGNAEDDGVPWKPGPPLVEPLPAPPAPTLTAKLNGPENGVVPVKYPPAPAPLVPLLASVAPPPPPPATTTYSTEVDGDQVGNDAKVPEEVKV